MENMEFTASSHTNGLLIRIVYPPSPNLTYNFKLSLKVFKQKVLVSESVEVYSKIFYLPEKQIKVEGLEAMRMYRVEI